MINIVLITDNNYVKYTAITIASIKENKLSGTLLNINILSNNLLEENKRLFMSFKTDTINVNIIDASDYIEKFKQIIQNRHVTYTALLKFYIPIIFRDLDKILYFDSDLIIQGDLTEFYNHKLRDYYAECVIDIQTYNKRHLKSIGFNYKKYFNSGVLLLNLNKLREDNITEKLIQDKLNNSRYIFMDQDTFNKVFSNNVRFISYKYNFLPELVYSFKYSIKDLSEFYNEPFPKDIEDLYRNCLIFHYGGKRKAWVYEVEYFSDLYKKYWELSPITAEFPQLQPLPLNDHCMEYSFVEKIFSIKVDQTYMYKIVTILGFKIKFKRKLV